MIPASKVASHSLITKIKKAAPIEEADKKIFQLNYSMSTKHPASKLFDKYKFRLLEASRGEYEARQFSWRSFSLETCQEALSNYRSLSEQPKHRYRARGWALTILREIYARKSGVIAL